MKYFNKNIMNFDSKSKEGLIVQVARFEQQRAEYLKEFSKNQSKLPEAAAAAHLSMNDAKIHSIIPVFNEKSIDIAMKVTLEWPVAFSKIKQGILVHYDVKQFNMDIKNSDHGKELIYSYGEMLMEGELWKHNFIFQKAPNEVSILCRKIDWIEN